MGSDAETPVVDKIAATFAQEDKRVYWIVAIVAAVVSALTAAFIFYKRNQEANSATSLLKRAHDKIRKLETQMGNLHKG